MISLPLRLLACFGMLISTIQGAEVGPSLKEAAGLDVYRKFALENAGDPESGARIFQRDTIACGRCHAIDGVEKRVGPNLQGVGDKFPRDQLIKAILEPDASIAVGYATHIVLTRDGDAHAGVLWRRDHDLLQLVNAEGDRLTFPNKEIVLEQSGLGSLMPTGLHESLSPPEFADLLAYLGTLHQTALDALTRAAMPDAIPVLDKPIRFELFNDPATNFHLPVWIEPIPGAANDFIVLEHNPSKIWILEKRSDGDRKTLFLDLEGKVLDGQYWGLMGLTFHPHFIENRKYYLDYQILDDGVVKIIVDERRFSGDGHRDSGEAPRRLLEIAQRSRDHHGGQLLFGEDGYLYIGTGDGGPQEDPEGNGQNMRRLSAAILRIDVDRRDPGMPYAIPATNPLRDHSDPKARREIWAYGIRQAWRFSFDPVTGDLWLGDVGQNRYEDVSIVRPGENLGWNVYEGFALHSEKYRQATETYVAPIFAYPRSKGSSVTGGYVYRGKRNPSYQGVYIFADFESKRVWGLRQKDRKLTTIREIAMAPDRIVSFSLDLDGELFAIGYDTGVIYRVRLDGSVFE
jgi:putative heme-binding domain-containing protein